MTKLFTLVAIIFFLSKTQAQLQYHQVLPSSTDTAIATFTSPSSNEYHTAFYNPDVVHKNLLFVFLPGTGGIPKGYDRIDSLAANMGYNSIGLMYPNSPSVGSLCGGSSDSLCFENVRLEIIDGIDHSSIVTVDTTNCIEHRLVKLLKYLQNNFPSENWAQFVDINNHILWNKIVISGHSQGGGHAGIIAKHHQVRRVVFFASPKDYNQYYNKQAAWFSGPHQTPAIDYYGFSHSGDFTGSTPVQQLACYHLFGMNSFGPLVNVDTSIFPYNNSHILTSSVSSLNAHGCVATDNQIILDINNIPVYRPVWFYMLDIPVMSGKNNYPEELKLLVYPNPFSNKISLTNTAGFEKYTLLNVVGQSIWTGNNIELQDFSNLTAGFYFLKVANKNGAHSIKLIKH